MRLAAITPTRGNRPALLEHCRWQVSRQTIPVEHIVVDYKPESDAPDLVARLRKGFAAAAGCDFVLFMEDDDYYPDDYAARMLAGFDLNADAALVGVFGGLLAHVVLGRWAYAPGSSTAAPDPVVTGHGRPLRITAMRMSALPRMGWTHAKKIYQDKTMWRSLGGVRIPLWPGGPAGIKHGTHIPGRRLSYHSESQWIDAAELTDECLRRFFRPESADLYRSMRRPAGLGAADS